MLSFLAFEEAVRACFAAIPEEFVRNVAGPVVVRAAQPHPDLADNYLLGECIHAPDFTGSGELHSTVYLYYGSFVRIAAADPRFDVQAEIRETVLHEVRHHVEDAAEAAGLADEDFVGEQHERMLQGLDFVDRYWRVGQAVVEDDATFWAIGQDVVYEIALGARDWRRAREEGLVLTLRGRRIAVDPGVLGAEPVLLEYPGHGLVGDDGPGALFIDLRTMGRLVRGTREPA